MNPALVVSNPLGRPLPKSPEVGLIKRESGYAVIAVRGLM
jgi:hypothetical protein